MFDNSDKSQENIRPLRTTSASLRYVMGAGSDPGKRKKFNEDSILAITGTSTYPPMPFGLFIVADGMGGYVNGQDASCCAIQAMAEMMSVRL